MRKHARQPRPRAAVLVLAPALGAVLLVGAAATAPAHANEVVRNEAVACDDGSCVDSFEVKCAQASAFLCVDVEGTDSDPTDYAVAGFMSAPTTMYGRAERANAFSGGSDRICFIRPAEGTMKALVTVTAYNSGTPHPPTRSYRLAAECTRNFDNAFATRNTTVTRKQNE